MVGNCLDKIARLNKSFEKIMKNLKSQQTDLIELEQCFIACNTKLNLLNQEWEIDAEQ